MSIHYTVDGAQGAQERSNTQTFQVLAGTSQLADRLPEPTVSDADDNSVYPSPRGAQLTVPLYPGVAPGDTLVVHTDGRQARPPLWHCLTAEDLSANELRFTLEAGLLLENANNYIALMYQYARKGSAWASRTLNLNVLHATDTVQNAQVHCEQSHALTLDLSSFKGDASVRIAPYRYMAEGDLITLHWNDGSGAEPLNFKVTQQDVDSVISFRLERARLQQASGRQPQAYFSVIHADTDEAIESLRQAFAIVDEAPPLPDRLAPPQVPEAVDDRLLPTIEGAEVTIAAYPDMRLDDEVILHLKGVWPPYALAARVTEQALIDLHLTFKLPGTWLIANENRSITLRYQYARADRALSSEPLSLRVSPVPGSATTGRMVQITGCHDRTLDLETLSGDATLWVMPYSNMQAGQKIEVIWQPLDGQPPASHPVHVLSVEDLGQVVQLTLPRRELEGAQEKIAKLHYRLTYPDGRAIDFDTQDIFVTRNAQGLAPELIAIPDTELILGKGVVQVPVPLFDAPQLDDELILHVEGKGTGRPQPRRLTTDDLSAGQVVLYLSDAMLEQNFDDGLRVHYQYARPGVALKSKERQLSVQRQGTLLPGRNLHLQGSHDDTVQVPPAEADGRVTVLRYADMAQGDQLTVQVAPTGGAEGDEGIVHTYTVRADDLTDDWCLDFVVPHTLYRPGLVLALTLEVLNDKGLRTAERQCIEVMANDGQPPTPRLPRVQVEGAQGDDLLVGRKAAQVSLPAYPDMAFEDEVLFYVYGKRPLRPYWRRIEDSGSPRLVFELALSLLQEHIGTFIDLSYQYGRPGKGLASEALRLQVMRHPDAIENTLVHCRQSHDLTIDLDDLFGDEPGTGEDALLTVLPYHGMAKGDELTLTWSVRKPGAPDYEFALNHTVLTEDVGQALTFDLHPGQLQEALGLSGELRLSVQPADALAPIDATAQSFKVVKGTPPTAPRPAAPVVQGAENGKLMPTLLDAKVLITAYTGMARGDEIILHMVGEKSARVQTLRVGDKELSTGLLELRIAAHWLLQHANSRVTLFYQWGRPGLALSSAHLALEIQQPTVPIVPGPVVHFCQATGTVVALLSFEGGGDLYVLPHEHIAEGHTVTLHCQRLEGDTPIEEAMRQTVTAVADTPAVFTLQRDYLEAAVGLRLALHYSVSADRDTPPTYTSAVQTFFVTDNDAPLLAPLLQPQVQGAVNGSLYPGDEPVEVRVPAYAGLLEDDEVLLYADGTRYGGSAETQWLRVELAKHEHSLGFTLSPAFIGLNTGKLFDLHYTVARPGLAVSSRRVSIRVLERLELPRPQLRGGSGDSIPARALRAGGTFMVAHQAAFDEGTVELRLLHENACLYESAAYRLDESGENLLFHLPVGGVGFMIGKKVDVDYLYTNRSGQMQRSQATALSINDVEKFEMPWLQIAEAQGNTALPLESVEKSGCTTLELHGWPFMAAGQRVRIKATAGVKDGGTKTFDLVDTLVTDEQAKNWAFSHAIAKDAFVDKLALNTRIEFDTAISLDGGLSDQVLDKVRIQLIRKNGS